MPVISWFYYCCLNESYRFIGTCEFGKREAFDKQVHALCEAHGWDYSNIKSEHHYLGSIRDNLSQM